MQERIIENWLSKASERSFQLPFCYILLEKGYKIIHVSRHCGMELGKDILAIGPDGRPTAFQLKGKPKLKLRDWRTEISHQIRDLTNLPLEHPSISSRMWHKSYLVINGELEEEVTEAINKYNRGQVGTFSTDDRNLHVITFGELLQDFIQIGSRLWPTELRTVKEFLEIIIRDERDLFPKGIYARIIEEHYYLKVSKKISKARSQRIISSAALLTSLISSNYSEVNNHYAEIESWTSFITYTLSFAIKYDVPKRYFIKEVNLAQTIIENSLENLYQEVKKNRRILEGDPFTDSFVISYRITILLSLLAIRNLYKAKNKDIWLKRFFAANMNKIGVWGESAFPHLLIIYLYHRRTNFEGKSSDLLKMYLSLLIAVNGDDQEVLFPNPYYSLEEVLLFTYGDQTVQIEEKFKGDSFTIDACIQLLVRDGEKDFLVNNWKPITKISQSKFTPGFDHEWFRNRCDHGTYDTVMIKYPTPYTDLQNKAVEIKREQFPALIDDFKKLIPLFLLLMPHRLESEIVKYLAELYEPVANMGS